MNTKLIGLTLFSITAAAVAFYPAAHSNTVSNPPTPTNVIAPISSERPRIEVVFVLDTTSSMSGFIEAAKEKIWSIATTLAQAQPAPELHMGLVAFRDRGDAYVTRVTDLSQDLDSMYATLLDYRAEGGGDGPESVNAALYEAVHSISWSQHHGAYKVIFLVGDAPPHMDYKSDVPYPVTLTAAGNKGIVVNTIQAGALPQTMQKWRHIAALSQGEYFNVAQSGGALAVTTPFDAELASLSEELDDTRLFYGSEEERAAKKGKLDATAKLHRSASVESRARRAQFSVTTAGEKNLIDDGDLVDDVDKGVVALDNLPAEQLPAAMQAMSKDELGRVVGSSIEARKELKSKIRLLAEKRDDYLKKNVAESEEAAQSLDNKLHSILRSQSAERELILPESPTY